MHREERAYLGRYSAQSPNDVAQELKIAAELLGWAFAGLDEGQLQRPCIYNFPEARERTVLWLGRHAVHEGEHHLRDVDAALRSAVAASEPRPLPSDLERWREGRLRFRAPNLPPAYDCDQSQSISEASLSNKRIGPAPHARNAAQRGGRAALFQQALGDHDPLHLVRALVDLGDLRVPHEPLRPGSPS